MQRKLVPTLLAFAALTSLLSWLPHDSHARQADEVQWIWFNEGDPTADAPAETRYFRRTFEVNTANVKKPADEGSLEITADNSFTVWINGVEAGKGDNWQQLYRFDVKRHLLQGKNVIAVAATNDGGPAGLVVRLSYVPNGQSKVALVSDDSWKAAKTVAKDWAALDFDDGKWEKAKALGALGKTAPWGDVAVKAGGGRFTVPEGFRVEQAVKKPGDRGPFSLVNMTFDNRGRLLVSQENGPILLCTEPDKDGVLQTVATYCELVKNSQGMCWVKDALLLVGNGPDGTGLYRCFENKAGDKIEKVELLHKFKGGMGEHGPHAILYGPDGWLYLVIGNHAWAQPEKLADNSPLTRWPTGGMGPDQGKPDSTEDVLLPRLNDARGHAANILAPGGTIWRLDHNGKNMSLVTAGFRNHFDAAFSPDGELFTFDSDMEWDENLPWYRAVRINHCPPGADFVWRTGAANTPDYYIDSLPPFYETGRGSPVGLEFYDHRVFPEKYRGAYFMGDWSIGVIWAVHLQREGATYKAAKVERFCTGAPMNVTDLNVGPDGAIYFTMGGRGSQGGVYRIVYGVYPPKKKIVDGEEIDQILALPQPLSAWSRDRVEQILRPDRKDRKGVGQDLADFILKADNGKERLKALALAQMHEMTPDAKTLLTLVQDKDPEMRAQAVLLLGVNGHKEGKEALIKALKDNDAFVRRRACEALVRAGIEPPVEALWPLLAEKDRFVRTAARLVLQRIDPKKWTDRLWRQENDLVGYEGIIALCKTNQAAPHAEMIFERLHKGAPAEDDTALLYHLRTIQMALFQTKERPGSVRGIALECLEMFPHKDWRVGRELAILLAYFHKEGVIKDHPVPAKLVDALLAAKDDRLQQIHYFYCLRLLQDGWKQEQKTALVRWYEGTKTWTGGHSFTPFLENIFRECLGAFDLVDRKAILAEGEKTPLSSLVLAQRLRDDRQAELLPTMSALAGRLEKAKDVHRLPELRQTLTEALVKTALKDPGADNYPYLVRALDTPNKLLLFDVVEGLKKSPGKPKADDASAYRSLIIAAGRLDEKQRWKVVEVLRHWSNDKRFGADDGEWKQELASWSKWYAQNFPKEPALPNVAGDKPVESKYKYEDLLTFLEKGEGQKGDVTRGRVVFEKAQCIKCHKYGKEGEGVGPDLTTLKSRFKRADVLESIVYPSKVISDQYRSTVIITKKGTTITGLAAVQGDTVTVLLSTGEKVTLKKDEIDTQVASLVSVMPEKLLDTLELKEIADLFAFLESEPAK
jgi:putative heme-binding domain-containing protein